MSAIAGLIEWEGRPAGRAVQSALDSLHLHGRDGAGLWDGGPAALGWRQTVLHEEDSADRQPRCGRSGLRLVFDGRIDNRPDLTRELGLAAEARRWPDSAFVLAAFEKWDKECCERLIGDFAFAVWDPGAKRLILARDHLGMRPLFFHKGADFVMFGTMPSALFTNMRVPMDLDDENVALELATVPKAPWQTFYRGIERVQPGHAIVFQPATAATYRHWRPETIPELRYRRDEDYVDAFREILGQAVSACLRTVHPVGSHLSSGWDSSTITATAASILAGTQGELTAFTAVPPDGWRPGTPSRPAVTNEAPMASAVAARFPNIAHLLVKASPKLDLAVMDRHGWAFEHPKKPVNILGWHERLHCMARQRGIRVMLSGFCGNNTMSCTGLESLSGMFRKGRLLSLLREWAALSKSGQPIYRLAAHSFGPYLPQFVWSAIRYVYHVPQPRSWIRAGTNLRALSADRFSEITRARGVSLGNTHSMDDRAFRIFCTTMPDVGTHWGSYLAAYDIDCRDPSADRRLLSFRAGIPDNQFLRTGQTKWLLRRAMAEALPSEMLNQQFRGLQAAEWFESATAAVTEIREEVGLIGTNPRLARLFDVPLLRELVNHWPATLEKPLDQLHYRRLLFLTGWARFARHFLLSAGQRK